MAAGTAKRTLALFLLLTLLIPTLTSCGLLGERSYVSVTTHIQQTSGGTSGTDVLQAEDYASLVNSILQFVSQGASEGTVRLYQYTGDVESDLEAACQEVLTEDPLGSYALRQVEHSYSRIVTYYECTFTFDYRREPEEIQSITDVKNLVALREWIQTSMDRFDEQAAFRLDFSVDEETIRDLVRSYYYATPTLALGYPRLSVTFYPSDADTQQILELRFFYLYTAQEAELMQQELDGVAAELTEHLSPNREGLWAIYRQLTTGLILDETGSDSVYDLMTTRTGNSESVALGVLLACQRLGIDCQVVEGLWNGQSHWWNRVSLDGVWYLMDVTASESEDIFLHTPEEMIVAQYRWDGWAAYLPADSTTDTAVDASTESTEPESADSETIEPETAEPSSSP